jgi:hypothetical protein
MDEQGLGPVKGPLQRARLHVRGGRRRLRQGKVSAGIVTLYDALEAAMEWFLAVPEQRQRVRFGGEERANSSRDAYAALVRGGVLDGSFDFDAFDRLTEQALHRELPGYDYRPLLTGIERVMTQLGVMPFDESTLPPEDPATF